MKNTMIHYILQTSLSLILIVTIATGLHQMAKEGLGFLMVISGCGVVVGLIDYLWLRWRKKEIKITPIPWAVLGGFALCYVVFVVLEKYKDNMKWLY